MIDFEPSEEQHIMRDAVAQFARGRLAGHERDHEVARGLSEEVLRDAHAMGLGGVALPTIGGGQQLGVLTEVLLEEQLGRVDAGAAFARSGPGALGTAVVELGSEEQQRAILTPYAAADAHDRFGAVAWSEPAPHPDRPGLVAVALLTETGFELSGDKAYVHNATLADRFVFFAQLEPKDGWRGLGAFIVDAAAEGVQVGERYDTLGLDAAAFAPLHFEGVRVPAEARLCGGDDLLGGLSCFFAKRALVVAARAVGLAHSAFELARQWCDTRVAFGKPIGHFQAVAFTLADRLMDIESARWMLWRAAYDWDNGVEQRRCLRDSAQAAAHALEVAMCASDDCVSLHGGAGFIRDVLAEKLMRDAKQLALCCPTSEQLDQLAAAMELGVPADPGRWLPTAETQAIFT